MDVRTALDVFDGVMLGDAGLYHFMHMIDPLVVEPYRYKIKYRDDQNKEDPALLLVRR